MIIWSTDHTFLLKQSSKSTVTIHLRKVWPLRMNLAHFGRPPIAHTIDVYNNDYMINWPYFCNETSSKSIVTNSPEKCDHCTWIWDISHCGNITSNQMVNITWKPEVFFGQIFTPAKTRFTLVLECFCQCHISAIRAALKVAKGAQIFGGKGQYQRRVSLKKLWECKIAYMSLSYTHHEFWYINGIVLKCIHWSDLIQRLVF